jgi:uncharacterized protein (TIGR01777 family)
VLPESAPPASGFLPEVCTAWEAEADKAREHGLRVVKLRIGIVLGADGGALAAMAPLFRWGLGGVLGSGKQWMSWIHVDDLARMIQFAVENEAVSGVVNGVAPNPVTNAEFTRQLAGALRRQALLPAPGVRGEAAVWRNGADYSSPRRRVHQQQRRRRVFPSAIRNCGPLWTPFSVSRILKGLWQFRT